MTIDRIVLWVMDDFGFSTLREHGGSALETLMARGALWPRTWCTPECMSSRAALLTGRYGSETGYLSNSTSRAADRYSLNHWGTVSQQLDSDDWTCAVAGKWQHQDEPGELGFIDQLTWRSTDYARFLDDYPGPLEPDEGGAVPGRPPRYVWPYLEDNEGLWATDADHFGPDIIHTWGLDWLSRHEHAFLLMNDLSIHKEWDHASGRIAYERGVNLATAVNDSLNRLVGFLNQLHERGLDERTLVLVTSDNGTGGGQGKSDPNKQSGCRTFTMAFGPDVVFGVRPYLIDATDFAPTIMEAAGFGFSPFTRGLSFLPQAFGADEPHRGWIASHFRPGASYPEGKYGYGPAIRTAEGTMIDGVGNVWSVRRPNDPNGEYFAAGADPVSEAFAFGVREAMTP